MQQNDGPVVLCIMDGWGYRTEKKNNAVAQANTPVFDELMAKYPHSFVSASGADVGLPDGQVGNSEVGHMNIGAGRVVMQDLPRINAAVQDGSLAGHPVLKELATQLLNSGGTAHVMGLLSQGGVHSHQDHMLAVINGLASIGVPVAVHGFTDGRDVLPKIAGKDLPQFATHLPDGAYIATISGRYYAMDRDHRWERTEAAFNAMTDGVGPSFTSCGEAIAAAYEDGQTDEFITPRVLGDYTGMASGDAVIMINFRADRARQLMGAFVTPEIAGFAGPPALTAVIGMTPYSEALDAHMTSLYPAESIKDGLGEVVARAGKRQLRLAETEKYPHVTFFFNGGDETSRDGEERHLVPSPKVATYDLQPEMNADNVLRAAQDSLNARQHDLLIINFANPDMVGHTGDLAAAIAAVETVDRCVGALCDTLIANDGQMLLTADHGNCEVMWDDDANSPHTAHTTNLVPLIMVNDKNGYTIENGKLADLAPTLLAMMNLDQPVAMTGKTLIRQPS